jgi:hypothetical protein
MNIRSYYVTLTSFLKKIYTKIVSRKIVPGRGGGAGTCPLLPHHYTTVSTYNTIT